MLTELQKIAQYVEWLRRDGRPLGDCLKGEIEIVGDYEAVKEHQLELWSRCVEQGKDPESSTVGIMYEDRYVRLVRDPVLFPPSAEGSEPVRGTYIRVVYKHFADGNPGVFILLFDREGRLVLNRTYRHALRTWTLEGQGTIAKPGESPEETVERCVRDEVGASIGRMVRLTDRFASDRGMMGDPVPMYAATVMGSVGTEVDDPTVAGHVVLTIEEYLDALREGSLAVGGIRHELHDSYTMSAVLLAGLKGLPDSLLG